MLPKKKQTKKKQIGHGAEAGRADPGPGCDGQQGARDARQGARTVQTQKVPFGVDSKMVLCEFFNAGHCEKGSKCSSAMIGHRAESREEVRVRGLSGRQALKRCVLDVSLHMSPANTWLYATDVMDKWDEKSLWSVILSMHGNPRITVDVSRRAPPLYSPNPLFFQMIACKYFTSLRLSRRNCEELLRSVPGPDGSVMFRQGFVSISIHLRTEVRASVAEEDEGRAEKANQISLEFLEVQLRGLEPHVRPPHMTPIIPPPPSLLPLSPS